MLENFNMKEVKESLVNASACKLYGVETSMHPLPLFPLSVTRPKGSKRMLGTTETLNGCSCLHQKIRTIDIIKFFHRGMNSLIEKIDPKNTDHLCLLEKVGDAGEHL